MSPDLNQITYCTLKRPILLILKQNDWPHECTLYTILTPHMGVFNIWIALCYVKCGIPFPAGNVAQHCAPRSNSFLAFWIMDTEAQYPTFIKQGFSKNWIQYYSQSWVFWVVYLISLIKFGSYVSVNRVKQSFHRQLANEVGKVKHTSLQMTLL